MEQGDSTKYHPIWEKIEKEANGKKENIINEDDEKLRTWGFFVILFIFELIRMQWHIIIALIALEVYPLGR